MPRAAEGPGPVQLEVEQVRDEEAHDPHQRGEPEVEGGARDREKDVLGVDRPAVELVHRDGHHHVHDHARAADQAELQELPPDVAVAGVEGG